MKKAIAICLAALMMLSLLAGCGNTANDTNTTDQNNTATDGQNTPPTVKENETLSGTVNLDGSTSMEKVVKALIESYATIQPDVTVNYNASGSGSGITAAIEGTVDIGLSSRELKDEETAQGAVGTIIALDGVAVILNSENTVENLTVEQIADIFSGKITNWSEVGGTDAPIAVLGREPGSGTRGAFEEIVGVTDACTYAAEYSSTGDVVGNVATNPNAIGYASLSAIDDTVKAVQVNGVTPSEETVKDGSFPIQRPFLMVTKEGTALSAAAQDFLDYAKSADVADLIAQAGAVYPN